MALFGFKKNKDEKHVHAPKDEKREQVARVHAGTEGAGHVSGLKGMRVTEKVTLLSERNNVYTFNIEASAGKQSLADTIARLYKVHPEKIRVARVPSKRVFVRGKWGVKRGGKKAYVYLKKGDKIDIA